MKNVSEACEKIGLSLLAQAIIVFSLGIHPAISQVDKGDDLFKAVVAGDLPQIRNLLDKGADVDQAFYRGASALILASTQGKIEIVQTLLDRGAKLDFQADDGTTALLQASQNGHEAIVQLLLAKGADVNHEDKSKWTPLDVASENGHEAIVQALLDAGADVGHQRADGTTALFIASQDGHAGVVHALLLNGANPNHERNDSARPLTIASQTGQEKVVQALLDGGAEINYQNDRGITALFLASYNGHMSIVQTLLSRGADTELRGQDGKSAADVAKTPMIKQILQATSEPIGGEVLEDEANDIKDPSLNTLESEYYTSRTPEALRNWEDAIMDDIQANPELYIGNGRSFPIPPIARGIGQFRFAMRPIETASGDTYEVYLEAADDQYHLRNFRSVASGSILRFRGSVPFPLEEIAIGSDLQPGLGIDGWAVRTDSGVVSNKLISSFQPLAGTDMYHINGDENDPLTFILVAGRGKFDGMIYLHGKGGITKLDGSVVSFP